MISARSVAAAAVAAALTVSTPFSAQAPAGDKEGVRQAALDYRRRHLQRSARAHRAQRASDAQQARLL